MSEAPRAKRCALAGVRLGELERTLLVNAPPLGSLGGLLIEAPEGTRSAQQGYLRAAKKLEGRGLLQRAHVRAATRAFDPRRARPFYRDGRFWVRSDASRRHLVRRVVVWATPLGEGIRRIYERELANRLPIRWSAQKVARAERFARRSWCNPRDHTAARDEIERRPAGDEASEGQVDEVFPPAQDQRRWHLCAACSRKKNSKLGSARLWDLAIEMLSSEATEEELERMVAQAPSPSSERPPLRFHRTELGMLVPTGRVHAG